MFAAAPIRAYQILIAYTVVYLVLVAWLYAVRRAALAEILRRTAGRVRTAYDGREPSIETVDR